MSNTPESGPNPIEVRNWEGPINTRQTFPTRTSLSDQYQIDRMSGEGEQTQGLKPSKTGKRVLRERIPEILSQASEKAVVNEGTESNFRHELLSSER